MNNYNAYIELKIVVAPIRAKDCAGAMKQLKTRVKRALKAAALPTPFIPTIGAFLIEQEVTK